MNHGDLNALRDELQKHIGSSPIVTIEHFKNWSTATHIENLLVVRPRSLEEIRKVVKAAKITQACLLFVTNVKVKKLIEY